MASIPKPGSRAFVAALEETLKSQIKETLKAPLMKIAETEIDQAVDAAVETLGVRVDMWRNHADYKDTIEILLKRQAGDKREGHQ